MKVLETGTRHIGHKVRISCPYCGTRVEMIQYEQNTDIVLEKNIGGNYRAKHIFYTCPVCDTRIISNQYKDEMLNIEIDPNVLLTQEEVREIYYPE